MVNYRQPQDALYECRNYIGTSSVHFYVYIHFIALYIYEFTDLFALRRLGVTYRSLRTVRMFPVNGRDGASSLGQRIVLSIVIKWCLPGVSCTPSLRTKVIVSLLQQAL